MNDATDVPDAAAPVPGRATVVTQAVALAALLALVGLGLVWELSLAPTGRGTLAIKVLPLAFAVPGLLKRRLYTCRWLSLFVWVYVAEGLVRLREPAPVRWLAVAEIVLALALFAACSVQVRARLAAGRPAS